MGPDPMPPSLVDEEAYLVVILDRAFAEVEEDWMDALTNLDAD